MGIESTLAPISQYVWDTKYRFKQADGTPIDATVEDTWMRIARDLASVEKHPDHWVAHFYNVLTDFKFLPAGRIVAGAGTGRNVTLQNCYVLGNIEDDLGSIFNHLREAALTMQMGGGIGYDFSTIRPAGSPVKGVGAQASGPLSFMDVWDAMCKTIMSGGCLAGDTTITTDQGFMAIQDIVNERRKVKVKTHEGWKNITAYFDNGVNNVIEVTFENGRSIVCTHAHRFHTINANGSVIKKPIGEMNVGDTCLFVSAPSPWTNATLDADLSYVLGHYWANGYTNYRTCGEDSDKKLHHSQITFADTDIGVQARNQCHEILMRLGLEVFVKPGDGKCTNLYVYGDSNRSFVRFAGKKGLAQDIAFPEGVDIVPFIAGYFDGDGSWRSAKKGPHFCSVSEGMLKSVQDHLMNLGIPSKLYAEERPGVWRTLYRLAISGPFWQQRFKDTFEPWLLKSAPVAWRKSHNFVMPPQALNGVDAPNSLIHGHIARGQNIGHQTFAKFFPDSELMKFGGMRITGVKPGFTQRVYDLEVEDTHSYVANGISVSNSRRGAMMATMRCDHPDIEAFIEAKRDPLRLRNFNVSVRVTDAFMGAVKNDTNWCLQFDGKPYKWVSAKELWTKIMRSTYDYAEPGVVFTDVVNRMNNLAYCETLLSCNPCSEQPLPPYGACLLGSINLARFVSDPFTDHAKFKTLSMREVIRIAIRMMDNVVDVSKYPLQAQREQQYSKRRLGLGVTGLADALTMLGMTYGSPRAVQFVDRIMDRFANAAYLASTQLAKEKGTFPVFQADEYARAPHVAVLSDSTKSAIAAYGLRNSHLTSIAPTGTISLFADNISSGIEPIFALSYNRKIKQADGTHREEVVEDYAVRKFRELHGADAKLPEYFVTAQSLIPADHIRMQAAVQPYVDSSISKTVNCPEDISFEDFQAVYQMAYDMGCKGCTTYRPNAITGSVLEVTPPPATSAPASEERPQSSDAEPFAPPPPAEDPLLSRADVLHGATYKLKWVGSEHALYVTVNDIVDNAHRRPFEVFINSKNMEHYAWVVALTRMISAVFRRGGDVAFVVEELKAVFDPRGGQWQDGKYVPSLIAAIGGVIERHMISTGFMPSDATTAPLVAATHLDVTIIPAAPLGAFCPKCGQPGLVNQSGCELCPHCGWSKCG